jgi:hypothetical protein
MLLNDGKVSNYGFGWVIIPGNGNNKIVWHNGDNPGYKTEIMRFLGNGNTLIMLCNNASAEFEKLVKLLQQN